MSQYDTEIDVENYENYEIEDGLFRKETRTRYYLRKD